MADKQIDVQQPIYMFKGWREIIFDAKWGFFGCLLSLVLPFLCYWLSTSWE